MTKLQQIIYEISSLHSFHTAALEKNNNNRNYKYYVNKTKTKTI